MRGLICSLGMKKIKLEIIRGKMAVVRIISAKGPVTNRYHRLSPVAEWFLKPRQCYSTRCAAGHPEISEWDSAAYLIRNYLGVLLVPSVLKSNFQILGHPRGPHSHI